VEKKRGKLGHSMAHVLKYFAESGEIIQFPLSVCKKCKTDLRAEQMPLHGLNNNLQYGDVPQELRDLSW
jgi:hypothetical protein